MKKSILKKLSIAIAILTMGTLLGGCNKKVDPAASTSNGKVTLRIAYNWTGSDPQAPYFEGMLKKFQEENKDTIDLKLEGTPGEDYRTKIKVDASAGNLPDVFTYWPGLANLKSMVEANQLLDISEYLNASKEVKKDQFPASYWDFYNVQGKTYGIPVSCFKGFFIANKDLFAKYNQKIPQTWDEFLAVSKVFNDNGIIPLSMSSKGGQPSHLYYSFLAYQFDNGFKQAQDLTASHNFKTDSNLKAAQAIDQLRKLNVFPKDTMATGDWGPSLALYNDEKAAMIYEFPWMIGAIKPEIGNKSEFFAMPAVNGGIDKTSKYTIGAVNMGYVINKTSFEDTKKKDVIVKLVDYITSDKMFSELAKGGMPPAKTVKIDGSTLNPFFARFLDYTKDQEALSQHENFFSEPNGFTALLQGLDELFAGVSTPEQFIGKVQSAIDSSK